MKIFLAILQSLPAILSGVKAVEDATKGFNVSGADKKKLIMNAFAAAATVGETIPEKHVAGISNLIDFTVSNLNASGILERDAKTNPVQLQVSQSASA